MEDIIYKALETELLSQKAIDYLTNKGLKPVKTVALFNNQYRRESEEKAYDLPAVFIEFSTATYLPQGKNTEEVQDRVRIHIEQKNFASSHSNSHNQEIALDVLRHINAVHAIVGSVKIEDVGSIYRVGRELDTDHGNAPVHIYEYGMQYLDCSTDKYGEFEASGANVGVTATKQLVQNLPDQSSEPDNPYIV